MIQKYHSWDLFKGNKNTDLKRHMHPYNSLHHYFTKVKIWKQLKCPSLNEWKNKIQYTYVMKYYSTRKKE